MPLTKSKSLKSAVVVLVVTLLGCGVDSALELEAGAGAEAAGLDESSAELAYPGASGELAVGAFMMNGELQWLPHEIIDGQRVFEGDILLPEPIPAEELVSLHEEFGSIEQALATRSNSYRWPLALMYYTVADDAPNKSRITAAIKHWNDKTRVILQPRTNQRDYVTFRKGSGCSATVGKVGGQQFINLSTGCSTGNIIHEIGHALGLWHTQARTDRGTYVTIHTSNIQAGKEHNFQTYTQRGQSGKNIGTYQTNSLMHYGSFSFCKDPAKPTITRKDGSTFSAQRSGLTSADISSVHSYYGL